MSLPLTPLVTDIQWPPWLKMGPAPKKCNVQSTCGLPMHMGGVRQAARCPYGAAEPPWAMIRCYSSSHPPILYTSCVGLLQLLTHNQLGHSARIARNRSTAGRNPASLLAVPVRTVAYGPNSCGVCCNVKSLATSHGGRYACTASGVPNGSLPRYSRHGTAMEHGRAPPAGWG